ncbi:MAG: SDR family oxidoreductase [Polyangiales bacterium]
MSTANRWVVVTGAAGGMGRAVVARCLADGYSVLASDRSAQSLESVLTASATLRLVPCELASADCGDALRAALEDAIGEGKLHGLVHLAGISHGDDLEHIGDDAWQLSMDVNVTAAMRISRALVPAMRAGGGGSIVHVASPVAILGARKVSYSASKAAMLGLNAAMARALGRDGIRVNALLPGPTLTKMTHDWDEAKQRKIASGTFLGRLCRPEEIAGAIAFLLGPDSSFVTGAVLDVTGGSLLGAHG